MSVPSFSCLASIKHMFPEGGGVACHCEDQICVYDWNKTEWPIAWALIWSIFIVQRANTTKTGIILISYNSEFGTAQLSLLLCVLYFCSSRYVAFVELIHLNDLLDDVTFPLSTNQKPRKNLQTDDGRTTDGRQTDDRRTTDGRQTDDRRTEKWLIERGCPR